MNRRQKGKVDRIIVALIIYNLVNAELHNSLMISCLEKCRCDLFF